MKGMADMLAVRRERPLSELTAGLLAAPAGLRVTDVTLDSRAVSAGALFLACRGTARHGLEFAEQALERGARAILYESGPTAGPRTASGPAVAAGAAGPAPPTGPAAATGPAGATGAIPAAVGATPVITATPLAGATPAAGDALPASVREAAAAGRLFIAPVPHLALEVGTIADRFFDAPSQLLTVAGFTGTNGKTTCAFLLAQALSKVGRCTGYLGTLGAGLPGSITPLELTTPDAVTVHRMLAALRALGAECVAMEVSSHALAQGRVSGVRFRAAAFTNLTHDHLDFHGSLEAYGAAKARLFERELAARIVNVDDAFGRELALRFASAPGRLILTSRGEAERALRACRGAELLRARDVRLEPAGTSFTIESSLGEARVAMPLLGEFNVENALTVIGVLLALEVPLDLAAAALAECAAPPGRMEVVRGRPTDAVAIVDYAHTPDALAKALRAARAHCAGRLRLVFGCGGDRDRAKRALMGRTARELADEIVVTDDNPRTEDPRRIVADILEGIETDASGTAGRPAAPVHVQHDRAAAIRETLARSAAGDVVLIAGKGHEDYQIVGRERRPFSDQAVAKSFLSHGQGRA